VEAQSGCDIYIQICMMHHMKAPKNWDRMKQDMLAIDDEIKNKNPQYNSKWEGQVILVQQTQFGIFGGNTDCYNREQSSYKESIKYGDSDIAAPADTFRNSLAAAGQSKLPKSNSCKNAQEGYEPY
jgi:hypothetical protein